MGQANAVDPLRAVFFQLLLHFKFKKNSGETCPDLSSEPTAFDGRMSIPPFPRQQILYDIRPCVSSTNT